MGESENDTHSSMNRQMGQVQSTDNEIGNLKTHFYTLLTYTSLGLIDPDWFNYAKLLTY